MPYAVNVPDWLARKDDVGLKILLAQVVDHDQAVDAEPGRIDGVGVRLICDDEQARAIVAVIRKKFHRNHMRLYYSTTGTGSWKRV
jgi:hypothetical protein